MKDEISISEWIVNALTTFLFTGIGYYIKSSKDTQNEINKKVDDRIEKLDVKVDKNESHTRDSILEINKNMITKEDLGQLREDFNHLRNDIRNILMAKR